MVDDLLFILDVAWPLLGLVAVAVWLVWIHERDDRKRRHLPPAE